MASKKREKCLLDLLFRSVPEAAGICRALQLAVKYRPVPQVSILLRSALSSDERIGVLASLLDQNIPLLVKSMPWPVSCS
ncbi:hypothetical protein niasHT_011629 [Heterodera trifolii]|uniref:Uncharacterized protein n=1 Tax=Heterodera trifolii TaxID=157864 RepID=A0ABD2LH07_9BILA